MKKYIILLVIINCLLFLNAQVVIDKPNYNFNSDFLQNSLLNPNKIKINHSLSFMSGVSSAGLGYYQSAYTNHLQLDLRDNLKFNMDLSFVNLGSMSHNNNWKFNSNNDNHNVVVPSFSLEFQPTDNTLIYFEYKQIQGYHPYNYYNRNEWWR
jgi:hypothetical protein